MRPLPVIGITLSVALVVTACSSSPAPPASPLSGSSALTCGGGARCAEPGIVRWSVTLPRSSKFDIDSGSWFLNVPGLAAEGYVNSAIAPNGYLATVTVAPGSVVFQQPGRAAIEAIDPATGRRLWTTKLATPPGFTPDTTVKGALVLDILNADGVITVYDSRDGLWWLVNAATGAAGRPRRLASYSQANGQGTADVLPVTEQSVALLNDTQVQGVDPATGSVRWQVPLRPWTGYAVIGQVLYADNDPYGQDSGGNNASGQATAIQRVDLATGRALPDWPLPQQLNGQGGKVVQFGEDPDALLVETSTVLAGIDPATGRAIWTAALPASTVGAAQAGPTGTPPTVEYLVAGNTTDSPPPGTGTNIWRILVVSLTTGQATPVSLGRSFPYSDAGIHTSSFTGDDWNLYGSVMLAAVTTKDQPTGSGGFSYTRLEGVDPQTGRVLWRGPWAGDLYVLGETFTGPPEIIAESCAPSGLVADQSANVGDEAFCDSERLYAINA